MWLIKKPTHIKRIGKSKYFEEEEEEMTEMPPIQWCPSAQPPAGKSLQPWGEWGEGGESQPGQGQGRSMWTFLLLFLSCSLQRRDTAIALGCAAVKSWRHACQVGRLGCCCPNLAETLKELGERWIDRYNPELHYLVLWFFCVCTADRPLNPCL